MKTKTLRADVETIINPKTLDTYRGVIYDENKKLQHTCRHERQEYSAALDDAQSLLYEIMHKEEDQRVTEELKDLAREQGKNL